MVNGTHLAICGAIVFLKAYVVGLAIQVLKYKRILRAGSQASLSALRNFYHTQLHRLAEVLRLTKQKTCERRNFNFELKPKLAVIFRRTFRFRRQFLTKESFHFEIFKVPNLG